MPRRARKKSSTGIYHVMLRGIDRAVIFHDDEDCERFLSLMDECRHPLRHAGEDRACPASGSAAGIFAYCLMGNHVHMLVQEGEEPIEKLMKRIGVRYAAWFNMKYRRTGHVFQDRFRSEPVEDDAYLLATCRYIALNPVKAGITEKPGVYEWCSFRTESPRKAPDAFVSPLPADVSDEELRRFILSDQPNIHPFPERISDRAAEAVLLQITGLRQTLEFRDLPKGVQKRYFDVLVEESVSVRQISRLTGIPKSNIARYLT